MTTPQKQHLKLQEYRLRRSKTSSRGSKVQSKVVLLLAKTFFTNLIIHYIITQYGINAGLIKFKKGLKRK